MAFEEENDIENLNVEDAQSQLQQEGTAESNYKNCSVAELISAMEGFCSKDLVETHRKEIEDIRTEFFKKQKIEFDEARASYIKEHGSPEGFTYESPIEAFKEVYGRVKSLRAVIAEERQKEYAKNLQTKLQIIDKIEKLTQGEESMNKTFTEFKNLQEEWKKSGDVSFEDEKSIWEKYHLQVGKFYDYVKINYALRDLDQKKNYEAKVDLCERAEKLVSAPQIVKAFADLQVLHKEWREIGPVKEEFKEPLWERFKNATTKINIAHQNYFLQLKEQEKQNLEKKTTLCERMDAINSNLELSQKQWTAVTNTVLDIQKEWRTIGYAPQKQNNLIYERFSKACDIFFGARKAFLDQIKEFESDNKKQKVALCEKAEAMKDRTDWKEATLDFINLQKDWKKIGSTSYKDSQKLWTRFSTACNAFFEAKNAFEAQQSQALVDNIPTKEALITKLSEIQTEAKDDALKAIAAIQEEWAKIPVPSNAKADLQNRFSETLSAVLAKLNVEKGAAQDMAFRIKMSALLLEKSGEDKVIQEAKRIKNRLSTVQNEIKSLENNVGFFSKSSDASKLIASVEKNIEKGNKEIAQLEQKLKVINTILRESK